MTTRLDLVLQKYPAHEEGIRQLAERDPSGNLKYLDWGAKMLAAKQALAPEIADVLDLFHQFNGRWLGEGRNRQYIRPDIYSYAAQDMAKLRDDLLKLKRAQDRKRRKREKLYRIEGEVEADLVYDSPDLIVRHIKNKNASVHYGLGTRWCISMLRERHFEHYESNNATFFFFERKAPVGDEYDKMALMVPRLLGREEAVQEEGCVAFTSLDRRVDMLALARVHGSRVFEVLRDVYERSLKYPGSAMYQVSAGVASAEQVRSVFELVTTSRETGTYELTEMLEAVCCNDSAPAKLLEEIANRALRLLAAAWRRDTVARRRYIAMYRRGRRWRPTKISKTRKKKAREQLSCSIAAALSIHPNTSEELRAKSVAFLRRKHIGLAFVRREKMHDGRVGVVYDRPTRHHRLNTVATTDTAPIGVA